METIYAVILCANIVGCQLASFPGNRFDVEAECEQWRDKLNGAEYQYPNGKQKGKTDIWYECWSKEIPVWRRSRS